jgi:putative ATP-binding cassette transporter
MPAGGMDDTNLREALDAVGLPELAGRLDETCHWALQLSPGEQQRIAFARALVQEPDWAVPRRSDLGCGRTECAPLRLGA